MKNKIILLKLFILILILESCGSFLCGELTGDWKEMYEKAQVEYSNDLSVERIPCDFFYIKVVNKGNTIDTNVIHNVHKELFNVNKKIGWEVLMVYDANENYIFSHSYNGKMYVQTGD